MRRKWAQRRRSYSNGAQEQKYRNEPVPVGALRAPIKCFKYNITKLIWDQNHSAADAEASESNVKHQSLIRISLLCMTLSSSSV